MILLFHQQNLKLDLMRKYLVENIKLRLHIFQPLLFS
jgi:hypothetical protein